MKRKMVSILGGMALALGLVACQSGAKTETTVAETAAETTTVAETTAEETTAEEVFESAKVRVAYMPNMGSASLLVTARDKGFFEEMGIEVEMVEFQGGPAEIAAMASGDIDISQIGHGAHALCAEGQAVVFELDCTSLADAVIGNTEKGVNTVADLKGKTVAVTSGTSAEIILQLALEDAGLKMEDLELVEMDANGIVSAMLSGQIDACATWSPGTETIKTGLGDKAVVLGNNADFIDKVTFPSSFITTNAYAAENRDILVRFTRALQKAADYRAANINEIAELVAKQVEVDKEVMLATVNEGNWISGEQIGEYLKDGTIKNYYENQQKVFINAGRLTQAVDISSYVMIDIMQEAYDANHK